MTEETKEQVTEKEHLTLGKLAEIANAMLDNNPQAATRKVCIPNNKGGMGGTSVTYCKNASGGIDWDAHKFFLWPEKKMVESGEEPIADWKAQATGWAATQMPKGWRLSTASAEEIETFYNWVLMFIRDCYSIYNKHI